MADVPYRPLATVEPAEGGVPQLGLSTNASMFGGGIAEAVGELGQRGEQIAQAQFETAIKFQQLKNETDADNATTDYAQELGQVQNEYRQLPDSKKADILPAYQNKIKQLQQSYAQKMLNPMAQHDFLTRARGYTNRTLESFGTIAGTAAVKAREVAARGTVEAAKASAVNNYALTDHRNDIDNVMHAASDYADVNGLEGDDKIAYVQKQLGETYTSLASARIAIGDTKGARALLDEATAGRIPGTDQPYMSRTTQLQMLKEVENREAFDERHKFDAENQEYLRYERQRKMASDKAGDALMQQIAKDPFSVDAKAIGGMTQLTWEDRERFAGIVKQWQERSAGGAAIKGDGPGFAQAWNAIHAPEGDPHKIWSQDDVYAMAREGLLTPQGATKLIKDINSISPQDNARIRTFLAEMRSQIVSPNGLTDTSKIGAYNAFVSHVRDEIAARGDHKKTLSQLLDKKSPDYLGNDAASFVKPMEIGAPEVETEAATETPIKAVPLLTQLNREVPEGRKGAEEGRTRLQAAVKANKITASEAAKYARARGWVNILPKPVAPLSNVVPAATQ